MSVTSSETALSSNIPSPANVDLQGGTLLDVKEYDEVDESDGCNVHVTEYHILSADGREEVTKTCRRKLKIECNQSTWKSEFANGRSLIEGKSQFLSGDINKFSKSPMVLVGETNKQLRLDSVDPQDIALNALLQQTQDKFMNTLTQQRNQFVSMFPDLFSEMRASSSSSVTPQTEVETVVNPDGSITTHMRSSRAYSSRFSKQEMYINGVKQESKCKFRAFMEYKGPDGGFKVKLRDNSEEDLSEEEPDDVSDDICVDAQSAISEIPDTQSVMILDGKITRLPAIKDKSKKKTEKAWLAAKELVDSEQRYVDKLCLLNETFRHTIEKERVLDKDKIGQLFSNIASLHQFHNTHLLPALMECSREWHTTRRISVVLRKRAPFLKMYSEYTNNYKRATKVFEENYRKKRRFAQIVDEIEMKPECENLPLVSHLICPVQRVMRYQLLLQEYKKHLEPSDPDYEDTEAALALVLDAASHANEMMRKLDRYRNVLEVQDQLGNSISLVSPGRELIKKGCLTKISKLNDKTEVRHLFLFNDILLLASERTLPGFSKLKVRALFDAIYTQICEGDDLEREHSFYLRGSDSENGLLRCIELMAKNEAEKTEWIDAVWDVISECISRRRSFCPLAKSANDSSQQPENGCAKCHSDFSFISRGITCAHCGQRFCKKCLAKRRGEEKASRVCGRCSYQKEFSPSDENALRVRTNPLAIEATSGDILHAGNVEFRGSLCKPLTRYFVARKDLCLYSYNTKNDKHALAMLPLPGCEVKISGERFSFTIKHLQRQYIVTAESEEEQIRWLAVLDLAANAVLREKTSTNNH